MQVVVLASGSQYRAQLLTRLGVTFGVVSPNIDETAANEEPAAILAERLAKCKAEAALGLIKADPGVIVQPSNTTESGTSGNGAGYIIIASDQVAHCEGLILGKPGTRASACAQLAAMSGKCAEFLTSLYMLDVQSGTVFTALDVTTVAFRKLDQSCIERYVEADNPLDCAGSFKVESLGISLFESVTTDDPTALIGLPLIKVCQGFRALGWLMP